MSVTALLSKAFLQTIPWPYTPSVWWTQMCLTIPYRWQLECFQSSAPIRTSPWLPSAQETISGLIFWNWNWSIKRLLPLKFRSMPTNGPLTPSLLWRINCGRWLFAICLFVCFLVGLGAVGRITMFIFYFILCFCFIVLRESPYNNCVDKTEQSGRQLLTSPLQMWAWYEPRRPRGCPRHTPHL